VTGFDGRGNPTGICTYYTGHGNPVYALCGWDLTGTPLYVTPTSRPTFTYSEFGTFTLPSGYTAYGWLQVKMNGYSIEKRVKQDRGNEAAAHPPQLAGYQA
jgi:hypothetical protein